jgi:hypothetical protein
MRRSNAATLYYSAIDRFQYHHKRIELIEFPCESKSKNLSWQSWAHRSYKLSERSKAMSDLGFSE